MLNWWNVTVFDDVDDNTVGDDDDHDEWHEEYNWSDITAPAETISDMLDDMIDWLDQKVDQAWLFYKYQVNHRGVFYKTDPGIILTMRSSWSQKLGVALNFYCILYFRLHFGYF